MRDIRPSLSTLHCLLEEYERMLHKQSSSDHSQAIQANVANFKGNNMYYIGNQNNTNRSSGQQLLWSVQQFIQQTQSQQTISGVNNKNVNNTGKGGGNFKKIGASGDTPIYQVYEKTRHVANNYFYFKRSSYR